MQGFFTYKQTQSTSNPDGKVRSCISCGLYKNSKNPRMEPWGLFKKQILTIGLAPTENDDFQNKLWSGNTGRILKKSFNKFGIDLYEDCLHINACHCRCIDKNNEDREPSMDEVSNCRKRTLQIINQYKPKLVLVFGELALFSLIGNRWKNDFGNIQKWRGFTIPDQDLKTWICPVFHPKQIESSENGLDVIIFEDDLEQVFNLPEFKTNKEPIIEIIEDLQVLRTIKSDLVAFDYETTGLKPQDEKHKIVCASVCYEPNKVYTFMLPDSKRKLKPFTDLLENHNIGKIAHNMKYEYNWTKTKLGIEVNNWAFDTMQAAHILDNRQGITGLKFQTYVNFGVVDYASEISPYLSADNKNANSINKVLELVQKSQGGKEKLLRYCALDSVFEYRLAIKQMKLLNF